VSGVKQFSRSGVLIVAHHSRFGTILKPVNFPVATSVDAVSEAVAAQLPLADRKEKWFAWKNA
jgi:hypothetical protein